MPHDVVFYMKDDEQASSSYYRLLQYKHDISTRLDRRVRVRVLVPRSIRKARYNLEGIATNRYWSFIVRALYAIIPIFTGYLFMAIDCRRPQHSVVILRSLYPKTMRGPLARKYQRLLKSATRVVWDFDDDIFSNGEISVRERALLEQSAHAIVVTSCYLASLLSDTAQSKCIELSTTDGDLQTFDHRRFTRDRVESFGGTIRLVWVASSAGMPDLLSIAEELDKAAEHIQREYRKDVVLHAVCNRPLSYPFRHLRLENERWSRAGVVRAMQDAHIGLMPLRDTRFARGKGGFKLVQYQAAGLPALASCVGFNSSIIVDGESGALIRADEPERWARELTTLAGDESEWQRRSVLARESWEEKFSYESHVETWLAVLGAQTRRRRQCTNP